MPDASLPTREPTTADLMRELLAIRDRLAAVEQRVYECQRVLLRIDVAVAALAFQVDDLAR
jgi:hypothetical protein